MLVSDGYGSSFIHFLNKTDGTYIEGLSFGGKGNATSPIQFNTPHAVSLDSAYSKKYNFPVFAVSDRSNNRIVWMDMKGNVLNYNLPLPQHHYHATYISRLPMVLRLFLPRSQVFQFDCDAFTKTFLRPPSPRRRLKLLNYSVIKGINILMMQYGSRTVMSSCVVGVVPRILVWDQRWELYHIGKEFNVCVSDKYIIISMQKYHIK